VSEPSYEHVYVAEAFEDTKDLPEVHLDVLGEHIDLPNLNSPRLPLGIVSAALELSDGGDANKGLRTFIDYFQATQPALWRKLETEDNGVGWLIGIIEAWSLQSGMDPKA